MGQKFGKKKDDTQPVQSQNPEENQVPQDNPVEQQPVQQQQQQQPSVPDPTGFPDGVTLNEYKEIIKSDWSYLKNEEMMGPVEWSEFKKLFRSGIVHREMRVLGGSMGDFERVSTKPKLLAALKYKPK